MSNKRKNQKAILEKLKIEALNPMQVAAQETILLNKEVVLLSPTGTGKTIAFLLPIIAELTPNSKEIQVLILVPSRELAIQIEQVVREMGSGYKVNAVYGGKSGYKDRIDLKHPPAVLIGTPGRIADHIRRENISTRQITTLVLDEFDKSLETGFEKEMREIVFALPNIKKKILTSATEKVVVPSFVGLRKPIRLDFLKEALPQLKLQIVPAPTKYALETLVDLLGHIGAASGIVFCNLKATIQVVSKFLKDRKISHTCFYGGLEQIDRERALIKFRNGTHRILVATDLAARGIDVPEMDYIIHYQLPFKKEEFIHRNGRTARMNNNGTAYLIQREGKTLPDYIEEVDILEIRKNITPPSSEWHTLFISGGRKDKISKGDIAGLFLKQGSLQKEELGLIEIKQECAFVAVPRTKSSLLIKLMNNKRLKKKKIRISLLKNEGRIT